MSNVEGGPDKLLCEVDRSLNDGRLKQHVYFKLCSDIINGQDVYSCLILTLCEVTLFHSAHMPCQ